MLTTTPISTANYKAWSLLEAALSMLLMSGFIVSPQEEMPSSLVRNATTIDTIPTLEIRFSFKVSSFH